MARREQQRKNGQVGERYVDLVEEETYNYVKSAPTTATATTSGVHYYAHQKAPILSFTAGA